MSTVRAQAAFWAGRTELDLNNAPAGCRLMAQAHDEAVEDVELANRAAFYLQRCANRLSAQREAAADSARAAARPSVPSGVRTFAVQIAAVTNPAAADRAMRALRAEGYDARVFRDQDGLLKVRVGQPPEHLLDHSREERPEEPVAQRSRQQRKRRSQWV